ncbi:MAG TPA: dihydrouridine synthase [Desulfobulbaceae bacterium]|nr:dihydrouridine synthase [Desulfobulbaceae bacterium]
MIHNQIRVRQLNVRPPLFLAPMAGLTHSALRSLLLSFGGVGLLSTEMLSARRLPAESALSSPYLIRTAGEYPLSYQLLVAAVEEVVPAVEILHRLGADAIDLNLGCPAPRVRQAGGGSSLMADPARVRRIVATARRHTSLPLTAKIRLGEALDEQILQEFCRMLAGEGIDLLTVHARLRREPFGRKPRWEWVGRVKQWLKIPVIANGGVCSVATARDCLRISGADGLMIGRAAVEKPWVFAEIAKEVYGEGTGSREIDLPRIYLEMVTALAARFSPERRLGRLKEFTHYFARNYMFGHHLAMAVQSSNSLEEAWSRALAFFARHAPDSCLPESVPNTGSDRLSAGPG